MYRQKNLKTDVKCTCCNQPLSESEFAISLTCGSCLLMIKRKGFKQIDGYQVVRINNIGEGDILLWKEKDARVDIFQWHQSPVIRDVKITLSRGYDIYLLEYDMIHAPEQLFYKKKI